MEHHLHLVATGEHLSREIRIFKSYTARQIIDWLERYNHDQILRQMKFFKRRHKVGQEYQVWQEGSHPQLITSRSMLNQKLDYIHHNPVRAGYVESPGHWRYSSFKHYDGKDCLLPITVVD